MASRKRKCFVYVMAMYPDPEELRHLSPDAPAWRKVGISTNPVHRRAEVQTGSPFLVRLEAAIAFPDRDTARAAEIVAHAVLGNRFQSRGEWFNAPHDGVEEILSAVAKRATPSAEMVFSWFGFVQDNPDLFGPSMARDVVSKHPYQLDPTGTHAFGLATKH